MSRPFNFFQSVSGIFVPTGGGGSGLAVVNPLFGQLLSGEGMYTPAAMIDNPIGYRFGLFADAIYSPFGNVTKLYAESLPTSPHSVGFSSCFSGNTYPVIKETGAYTHIALSGQMSGDAGNKGLYFATLSGSLSGDSIDKTYLSNVISGKQIRDNLDKDLFSVFPYGINSGDAIDKTSYLVAISGNIIKYERNRTTLEFQPEAITWQKGYVKINEVSGQSVAFELTLNNIFWSYQN